MNTVPEQTAYKLKAADRVIARILKTGMYIIMGLYISGVASLLGHDDTIPQRQHQYFHHFQHFLLSLFRFHPRAYFYLGTLAAIFTPLTSIFVLFFIFTWNKNKKFIVITAFVSLMIVLSVIVGTVFHIR